ncbi:hypothetical protein D3C81_1661500 [compost metagenome]
METLEIADLIFDKDAAAAEAVLMERVATPSEDALLLVSDTVSDSAEVTPIWNLTVVADFKRDTPLKLELPVMRSISLTS